MKRETLINNYMIMVQAIVWNVFEKCRLASQKQSRRIAEDVGELDLNNY